MIRYYWKSGERDDDYQVLAILESTPINDKDVHYENPGNIIEFAKRVWNTRIKPVGCVTLSGRPDGRCDFAFLVHNEDIAKFAVQRFNLAFSVGPAMVPRWWKDAEFNTRYNSYPADFREAYPILKLSQ